MTTTTDLTIRPFEAHVPDEDLADLRRRIAAMRWPSKELVGDRSQGVQLATIQELARYWITENALPLIITHGWPGSVIELLGVIGPLTDPAAHGRSARDAFHLVVPSIPATASPASRPNSAGTSAASHKAGRS